MVSKRSMPNRQIVQLVVSNVVVKKELVTSLRSVRPAKRSMWLKRQKGMTQRNHR